MGGVLGSGLFNLAVECLTPPTSLSLSISTYGYVCACVGCGEALGRSTSIRYVVVGMNGQRWLMMMVMKKWSGSDLHVPSG
jgi:hypothetical protein